MVKVAYRQHISYLFLVEHIFCSVYSWKWCWIVDFVFFPYFVLFKTSILKVNSAKCTYDHKQPDNSNNSVEYQNLWNKKLLFCNFFRSFTWRRINIGNRRKKPVSLNPSIPIVGSTGKHYIDRRLSLAEK